MIFGITMSPKSWVIMLTAIAFALIAPFAIAGQLAAMAPAPFAEVVRVVIGYVSVPLLLCLLNDRGSLNEEPASIFFYLYKWIYLAVGLAATAIAIFAGGGFEGGILLFGLTTTAVGLMVFWQSWKVDSRNQQAADRRLYGPEEPLDRKTLAILDAAQSRASDTREKPLVLDTPARL